MDDQAKRKLKDRIKDRYRVVVYHDTTFNTVRQLRFSLRKLYFYIALAVLAVILLTGSLIFFTSIRHLVPGYPNEETRNGIVRSVVLVDSLSTEIEIRDKYFRDFRRMLAGEDPVEVTQKEVTHVENGDDKVQFKKFNHDSLFKAHNWTEENLKVSDNNIDPDIANLLFYAPLRGAVTSKFDSKKGHYGVDVVAEEASEVNAVLEGKVIMTGYTEETGYTIVLMHENNIVSIYKHNKKLLKKEGDVVFNKDAIAIMGNTGKYTTGPHLHFELWYNGKAVNPELYINF